MARSFPVVVALLALLLHPPRAFPAPAVPAPLCGTWEHRGGLNGQTLRLVLRADGTGTLGNEPVRCMVSGDQIDIELDEEVTTYSFSIAGGALTLTGGDLDGPTRFTRVGATPAKGIGARLGSAPRPDAGPGAGAAPDRGPDRGIVGRWSDPSGAVIEFLPDGTGANRRGAFRYTARDGALTFNDGATVVELGYRVEADRLVVEAQGQSVTFTRAGAGGSPVQRAAPARRVVVNRTALTEAQVTRLEQVVHVRVLSGEYWYDRTSGAWGLQGGPTLGFLPAGLALGGPLPADASGGGTNVFINGRELHPFDVAALQRITLVLPGRYWVDATGNCGYEGNPVPFMNLAQLAAAASARSGGAYHTRSDITGIGSGGDGRTSYVMGKDWSVIIGE